MRRTTLQKLLSAADSLLELCMRSLLAATLMPHLLRLTSNTITEQFDAKAKTMSCHGTFVLTNGSRRDGSIIARPNAAGAIILLFTKHNTDTLRQPYQPLE
jgi:hypothetical protein